MRLFNKEKDFILRVLNLIFIVWIIITLILFYNGMINLFVKKPLDTYSKYREESCNVEKCSNGTVCPIPTDNKTDKDLLCEARYAAYKENIKENNLRYIRETISPLLSAMTVGVTLYLLNRKQKKVK